MTNDQLRAFVAVVEQGSFRAGAEHIYKTQSTVSAAVRTLEQQFGFLLFNRDSYRPALTTEGKAFYRQARQLLSQVQELEMLGHQLARGTVTTLSISLSAMCAIPPGLDSIRQFCDRNEELSLSINTQHLSGVLEQLQLEKADLAIGPHHGLDESYEFVEITRITMITVAAPDYVEVPESGVVLQRQLRQHPHILISDTGSKPFDHVNVLPGGRRWYVNDYQMKKALLLAGMGWARIPAHMIEAELQQRLLIPLEVENFNSRSQLPIYLIRLRQQPLSAMAQDFWQQMTHLEQPRGNDPGVEREPGAGRG